MTLAEIIEEVYSLTNRRDLVDETAAAVRAAVLKAHQSDYFVRDLIEVGAVLPSAEYIQQFNFKTEYPRWRAVKYVRVFDYAANTAGIFLDRVDILNTQDNYALNREDIFYISGDNLNIRTRVQWQYYLIGYYSNPVVTDAGFTSWIAADAPYAIVYEAARVIFKTTGYDEQGTSYERLRNEEYQNLKRIGVLGYGE